MRSGAAERDEASFAAALERVGALICGIIRQGLRPIVLLDLDETVTEEFGSALLPDSQDAMSGVALTPGVLGLDSGASLEWVAQRVLRQTHPRLLIPWLILSAGQECFAWDGAMGAYIKLPIHGADKGEAATALARYLGVDPHVIVYIADFPGSGDQQAGIDDPVLRQPLGAIIAVGRARVPESLAAGLPGTMVIKPAHLGGPWVGPAATDRYLKRIARALAQERPGPSPHGPNLDSALQARLACERPAPLSERAAFILPLSAIPGRVEVASSRAIVVSSERPGLAYAGVRIGDASGPWARTYAIAMQEVERGLWQGLIRDPEVNALTCIFYGPEGGKPQWRGVMGQDIRIDRKRASL
jgi:hypothetical protein